MTKTTFKTIATVKKHEQKVRVKLRAKVRNSVLQKKALLCIGYHLPDNVTIKKDFTKPVYFVKASLQRIDFSSATFSGLAYFRSAVFSEKANFGSAKFSGQAVTEAYA